MENLQGCQVGLRRTIFQPILQLQPLGAAAREASEIFREASEIFAGSRGNLQLWIFAPDQELVEMVGWVAS